MNDEAQLELPLDQEENTETGTRTSVISLRLSGVSFRDLLSLIRPVKWWLPPISALSLILDRIIKIFEIDEEKQKVIRIKRTKISFTPTCYFPIREFAKSPVLNN